MFPGRERPALQSVRRSLSYVIASAATCAPFGAALRSAVFVPRSASLPISTPESRHRRKSIGIGHRGRIGGPAPERPEMERPGIGPVRVDRFRGGHWMKLRKLGALVAVG